MTPQDIQKLLGGYATGTLTDAEQQALFAAALEDQQLFDALAQEQPLRDLLRDPAAKTQLLTALDPRPARRWAWWPGAVAAALAGVAAVTVVAVRMNMRHAPIVDQIAEVRPPLAPSGPVPVGPLGVVPVPGARKQFVPPRMTTPVRSAPLPEPPKVDLPRRAETADLKAVIGGVPQAPAPPAPKVSSSAESIEVTAAAPVLTRFAAVDGKPPELAEQVEKLEARSLFYGGANGRAMARVSGVLAGSGRGGAGMPPANAGLRYTVLRKEAAGNFVEADPAELKTGDTVALRITANTSGFLSVNGSKPVAVSGMTPHTTAPLPAGQQEVRVVFTRQQQPTAAPAVRNVSEADGHDTYVANPVPGQPVNLVIKLQYK